MPPVTPELLREAMRTVNDPEVGMNIVDLGLIYGIALDPESVHIAMTMTSPACPVADLILDEVRATLDALLPAGWTLDIELVWDPPWSPAAMSAHAKQHFGWEDED